MDPVPLIVIVGPTAVGKTALGIALAQALGGEIISADSRQLYRGMDIGTAKPTPAERAAAVHHLIDIANPDETVNLATYLELARQAISDVTQRGRVPLLVGGTGQYIRALLEGWQVPEVPPHPTLRAELEARPLADLWAQLMALDPAAASFVDARNPRRVIRALEVCLITGRPFSEQRRMSEPPYRALRIGLTMERRALYARADARVDAMMEAGLEAEVRALLERGYSWELPAMAGLGYRQFRPYFEGRAALTEVVARIKLETHDFIRRQYAWFRPQDPTITWLDAAALDVASIVAKAEAFLSSNPIPSR